MNLESDRYAEYYGNSDVVNLQNRRKKMRQKRHGGLINISGKVFSTVKHKFWDSNTFATGKAVMVRDSLANLYMEGKQLTSAAADVAIENTLSVYRFAREKSTKTEIPPPLVPVRDKILIPAFKGVERSVEFIFSDQILETYNGVKNSFHNLPLGFGTSIIVPGIETLENAGKFFVVLLQAPLPSSERVAKGAEFVLDRGKYGMMRATRETLLYFNLIDVQITRMLTMAQWEMLGYGPYADLPNERKKEVCDRVCDRYLSMHNAEPFRRYEFIALIRWKNCALHNDLIDSGVLLQRIQKIQEASPSAYLEDEWISASAPWRKDHWHYNDEIIVDDVDESRVRWFKRKCHSQCLGSWTPFSSSYEHNECLRLERRYRSFVYKAKLLMSIKCKCASKQSSNVYPEEDFERIEISVEQNRVKLRKDSTSWKYQVVKNEISEVALYNYSEAPEEVLVEQGRKVVCLNDMYMRPVYWAFAGRGERVRRAVWLQETGSKVFDRDGSLRPDYCPYSSAAALILEDAYQYLKWKLFGSKHQQSNNTIHQERPSVLLTVQVLDQLIQFRSLSDIMSVRRTIGGALSIFGRRKVHRGVPQEMHLPDASGSSPKCIADHFQHDLKLENESVPPLDESESDSVALPTSATVEPELLKDNEKEEFLKNDNVIESLKCARSANIASLENLNQKKYESARLHDNLSSKLQNTEATDADLHREVSHLILVVHGIGDALSTVDLGIVQLKSLEDCCDAMRSHHAEVLDTSPLLQRLKLGTDGSTEGRVEYLPIEWHSRFKSRLFCKCDEGSGDCEDHRKESNVDIWDITLSRAAALRAYTNDTILDILYFMSPEYHQIIVDEVTNEINRVLTLFRRITPKFSGKVSIAAHSLGAIICFDILANQKIVSSVDRTLVPSTKNDAASLNYYAGSTIFSPLNAEIENLFCLGSPIGMFLMIRGQHMSLGKSFKLAGAKRLYNIFHPFDPVAFRLEPLLECSTNRREPEILPTWQGGLRVHYQVRRWWQVALGKLWKAKERFERGIEERLEELGLIADVDEEDVGEEESMWQSRAIDKDSNDMITLSSVTDRFQDQSRNHGEIKCSRPPRSIHSCKGGQSLSDTNSFEESPDFESNGMLAGGYRVDYSLQEKEIEVANEYLFALGAHLIYWTSKDLCFFIAKQILRHERGPK